METIVTIAFVVVAGIAIIGNLIKLKRKKMRRNSNKTIVIQYRQCAGTIILSILQPSP